MVHPEERKKCYEEEKEHLLWLQIGHVEEGKEVEVFEDLRRQTNVDGLRRR